MFFSSCKSSGTASSAANELQVISNGSSSIRVDEVSNVTGFMPRIINTSQGISAKFHDPQRKFPQPGSSTRAERRLVAGLWTHSRSQNRALRLVDRRQKPEQSLGNRLPIKLSV